MSGSTSASESRPSPAQRARVLIEALPYIQQFRGSTVVIKFGGSAMEDPTLIDSVLRDIVLIDTVGIDTVLVHGGGKAITRRMATSGLEATFVGGLRVTDPASIDIVRDVLDNEVNPAIVSGLVRHGAWAKGLRGLDVFLARKAPPTQLPDGTRADLGRVGEIFRVRDAEIRDCVSHQVIPVISPLAKDDEGQPLNINADLAAMQVAISLRAAKLIYLSDVPGVLRDPADEASLIPTIHGADDFNRLKDQGILRGGMLPKVQSALDAIESGVGKVQFVDGRVPHSLLLELFTDEGIGTEITGASLQRRADVPN